VYRDERFVDLSFRVGDARLIEAQVLGHERVHRRALRRPIVVPFVGKVCVLNTLRCTHQRVHAPNVRKLHTRHVLCPVRTARDNQLRLRCEARRDFHVIRLVRGALVDRHAALANAAAVKVGRHHHDRHRYVDPRIDRRQNKRLRAAARFAGHRQPLFVNVP